MNGRTDICIGIKLIKTFQKFSEYVISFKNHGPQLLAVWKQHINDNRQRVGHHNKFHKFCERLRIIQQGIDLYPDQENKPQKIRNEEVFTKRDLIIQRAIEGRIEFPDPQAFHQEKKEAIYRPE